MEIWKKIKGFEDYSVSNYGKVKSLRRDRLLKPDTTNKNGYERVTFSVEGVLSRFFVHRLVAEAFLTPIKGKEMVNHINGVKTHNYVENLEWCDCSQNTIHAFDNGLRDVGEDSTNAQLTNEIVHKICKLIQAGWRRKDVLDLRLHPRLNKSKFDDIRGRRCWKRISSQYQW